MPVFLAAVVAIFFVAKVSCADEFEPIRPSISRGDGHEHRSLLGSLCLRFSLVLIVDRGRECQGTIGRFLGLYVLHVSRFLCFMGKK